MLDAFMVPRETTITAKTDSTSLDISGLQHRLLLIVLEIRDYVEQESLDLAILGSVDGQDWTGKPLATFPQQFYSGEYPLLLDLVARPEIKFLRARIDVARWGRGSETPMFVVGVSVREVSPDMLATK